MIKKFKNYNDNLKINFEASELLDNSDKYTPNDLLIKSCKLNSVDGVRLSITKGADIHTKEQYSLNISIINNNYDIVKLLLLKGSKVTDVDMILNWLLKYKHYDILDDIEPYLNEFVYRRVKRQISNTNESIKNLLIGPSEDEILIGLRKFKKRNIILRKSFEMDFEKGVRLGLGGLKDLNKETYLSDHILEQFSKKKWFNVLMDMKIIPPYYEITRMIKNDELFVINELIYNGFDINEINTICEMIPDLLFKKYDTTPQLKLLFENGVKSDGGDVLIAVDTNNLDYVKLILNNMGGMGDKDNKEIFLKSLYISIGYIKNVTIREYLKNEYNKL